MGPEIHEEKPSLDHIQDIATRVIAEGLNPDETLVSDVMTRQPRFVESESSAVKALQIMVTGRQTEHCSFCISEAQVRFLVFPHPKVALIILSEDAASAVINDIKGTVPADPVIELAVSCVLCCWSCVFLPAGKFWQLPVIENNKVICIPA